ncbi:hypothetical protein BDU57DRAFT_571053 [Ampelomyces quisqualis]|uniref:DUF6594 domain-containing protein n=1 Tax=Ampelomyces quisqualis TaxID=50730 RepID=A0A6A5QRX3_AMPQU|nr:hypothetical protein BDU57DRAFT_571053 [Ampelomyces quisqualis]
MHKSISTLKFRKDEPDPSPFLNAWRNNPSGHPRLAERIAVNPETGIYRRFDALNARRILYLQAELCILERKLQRQEEKDNKATTGKGPEYSTDYQIMLEAPGNLPQRQLELIQEMQDKLEQYNNAVIQISMLHKIKAPDRFDLHDMQMFLQSAEFGPPFLTGADARTWGSSKFPNDHPPDLIGVHPRLKEDTFSRVVAERAIHLFKCGLGRLTKGNKHHGRRVYYDSTVLKVTFGMTSGLAALLPITSILVLVNLHSLKAQLWTVAAFNVLISVCLTFFTDAKRTDVFAVNAA